MQKQEFKLEIWRKRIGVPPAIFFVSPFFLWINQRIYQLPAIKYLPSFFVLYLTAAIPLALASAIVVPAAVLLRITSTKKP